MRLVLTEFGVGICEKTDERYVWDVDNARWIKATAFPELDDLARKRLEHVGIDIDASFQAFLAEIRVFPPDKLLRDLGRAPILSLTRINSMHSGALFGWKHGNSH